VGSLKVLALLDATGPFFLDRDAAIPAATAQAWRAARRLDPGAFGREGTWNLAFRCYAIRGRGARTALVDTGIGPQRSTSTAWMPVPGALPHQLGVAGIDRADVDAVVLTHLHEDHCGWSVGTDGRPVFPNATYLVQRQEVAALSHQDEAFTHLIDPLMRAGQLQQVEERLRLLPHGRVSSDTVTLVPTPGHTPGHQSVVVDGGDDQLVVTGDVLVHAVQLVDPATGYVFEHDQTLARESRAALLADASTRRAVLATAHLTQPFVDAR
jgi:glyoxylase-like metal-dependent hydrolase (beta-lactamase superfamily II)